jgi:hypothetical protein
VVDIDRKIDHLQAMRARLEAVMAAERDSLTDCSFGRGLPISDTWERDPRSRRPCLVDHNPRTAISGGLQRPRLKRSDAEGLQQPF